ncbi:MULTISPECIES: DeoR/GlpR family DNA-binding transcription regulator [unclassified Staphylococcus]|uniref:DeoR/GlpR family DNA-binding transcription regulator n=1 Tax=unclassified Staphylococcus TaxID=91994 RepID=UPI001882B7EE|nr:MULTISPECIES: DeoR/GlpR family DNA-binding transcription regulator [unclassified Staphylococcus]MBF2758169.1 DeoR/GlpR transcriptional regulator [Staphylococcus haemolyticus]MBF2774762.1 DeoR/GlpR transcriptional regulator [Staphylococcus haemolyticus]MBF2777285.1 DeoR/GlpR transcriptional regulator [Staphylococcus haemolyticus]MBF2816132.1 DeoR/GlpR transcriptional regulator [Staphylococcus haemolyticus]MBF9720400.1 DeoR/GlpR transcriptional regulator [Staphylococcus haemolyticus]
MLPTERREKIIEKLEKEEFLELKHLHKSLNISMETLRRDIQQLVKEDLVSKEYGGIRIKKENNGESIIEKRLNKNLAMKQQIAEKALTQIEDGDCIFLDSGSTTLQISKELKKRKNLTIITNSIPVMMEILNQGHTIISIGGKVRASEQSITSYDFLFNFDRLNIDKAFICCSGISFEKGITDYNLEEIETRRKILNISNLKFLTADSSKCNQIVTVKICELTDIDAFITDDNLENDFKVKMKKLSINVL